VRGLPPSANGASSLHLRWDLDGPLQEVSVELTVELPPRVPRLYFWALQADFAEAGGRPAGGAHLGLQWHPGHPGSTAVNWGGYHPAGGELTGTASQLPSATGNPNTRDHPWVPGRPYRLSVAPAPAGEQPGGGVTAWRGTVIDAADGRVTTVRDLLVPGDRIRGALVWSEVFARCDDPQVAVRWSAPRAVGPGGAALQPVRAAVSYQSHAEGGCANTDSSPVAHPGPGITQRTNSERATPGGSMIPWPG
jgi:hypothetical protein